MLRLRALLLLLLLSALPTTLSCAPTRAKSAAREGAVCDGEPSATKTAGQASAKTAGQASAKTAAQTSAKTTATDEVEVGSVAAPPLVVTNANGIGTGDNNVAAGGAGDSRADGWTTHDGSWGIEQVSRAQAIARIRTAPVRVVVEATGALDECRNGLATHAYFDVPAAWGAKPFQAAVIMGEVLPWHQFQRYQELYVAGVRVGTLHVPQASSCNGPMPARDAAVIALVPVKTVDEGRRLLERMR
jgi:hypothetical protein